MKRAAVLVRIFSFAFLTLLLTPSALGERKIKSVPKITAPAASDLSFAAAVNFDAGYYTLSIAAGDFNRDGKLDLTVINCVSLNCPAPPQVAVLMGNGDGTFGAPVGYDTGGTMAGSVMTAEVNSDGKLDLVVNGCGFFCDTSQPGIISVLLGNGDGTFQTPMTYSSGGAAPTMGAIADVNRDGNLDVVIYNAYAAFVGSVDGIIGVLLGNGDGTFQSALTYDSGLPGPGWVFLADVNGDDKTDLLLATVCPRSICGSGFPDAGSVSVFLGNGDGSFQPAVTYYSGGAHVASIAVADLNGDGRADVVAVNSCAYCATGTVSVLLGNGDGTLQPAVGYTSGGKQPFSVAIADVNGDANADLVVTNCAAGAHETCSGAQGSIGVLLGNGDGTFQPVTPYSSGAYLTDSVVVGDANGDEKPDLLFANEYATDNHYSTVGSVGILTNTMTVLPSKAALISSLNPANFGQSVTLTATVTPGAWGNGTPTGTVSFYDAGTNLGTSTIDSSGEATLTSSSLSVGTQSITAVYAGDTTFASSTSHPVYQVVEGGVAYLWPASLIFGIQSIGTSSSPQQIALTNSGNVTLTLNIAIVGANASDFSQTNNCGSRISVNSSCQINVTFTPVAKGNRTAAVSISDNAPGSPQIVSLYGGTPAGVSLVPLSVTFPTQYVGTTSLPQTVTLTNTGTDTLVISNVSTSVAEFGILNACGSSVTAGSSCAIGVFFDPATTGTRTGTLTVTDNAGDSPQSVSLIGNGQDFSMSPSGSASATVSPGQTANYTISIAPGGGFNQSVSLSCSGAPAQSTCSVSPNSVNLNGSTAATVSVAVTTSSGSISQVRTFGTWPTSGISLTLWLSLFGFSGLTLMCVWGCSGYKWRNRVRYVLPLVCLVSFASSLGGCGSSSISTGGSGGTQAGTYTISVSGSFSTNATSISHTTKLTLIVQ